MPERRIQQQYEISAPPAKVFRALTRPVELTGWMLESATLSLRPGSPYWFTWPGGYQHEGQIVAVKLGRSLTISWPQGTPRKPLGITQVRFTVRRKGKGSVLVLVHSGFGSGPQWVETYALSSSGWAYFLTNLKSVLETGHDLRRDDDKF
jgi:uncharacterized protein YndB with AHSA1/START domain